MFGEEHRLRFRLNRKLEWKGRSIWSKEAAAAFVCVVLSACSGKSSVDEEPKTQPVASFDELIMRSSCLSCHLPGNAMGSPTWEDVAGRYASQPGGAAILAAKIGKGGGGAWGTMDMPPYPELTSAELQVLARGVLSAGQAPGQKK